jgi:hypothetical protein
LEEAKETMLARDLEIFAELAPVEASARVLMEAKWQYILELNA